MSNNLDKEVKFRISEADLLKLKLDVDKSEFEKVSPYCRSIILKNKIYTKKSVKDDASAKQKFVKIAALIKKTLGEGVTIENRKKLNAAINDLLKLAS